MGKAWRNINPSKPHQGLGAIPAPLAGFERSGEHDLTCAGHCSPSCTQLRLETPPCSPARAQLCPHAVSEMQPCKSSSERGTAQPTSSQAFHKGHSLTPTHRGARIALGSHSPYKIHQSCSPSFPQHLLAPNATMVRSSRCFTKPKIVLQKNVVGYKELLVSISLPLLESDFIFTNKGG